jgi:hypothetical protein
MKGDDQRMLISLYHDRTFWEKNIKFDENSLIFLTIGITVDKDNGYYYLDNDKVIIKSTGLSPCFIHGPVNTDLCPVLKAHGYDISECKNRPWNHYIGVLPHYLPLFYGEIICLFLFIIVSIFMYKKRRGH